MDTTKGSSISSSELKVDTPEDLRRGIQSTRESLDSKMAIIQEKTVNAVTSGVKKVEIAVKKVENILDDPFAKIKEYLNLRRQFEMYPLRAMGISLVSGALLGSFLRGRNSHAMHALNHATSRTPSILKTLNGNDNRPKKSWLIQSLISPSPIQTAAIGLFVNILGEILNGDRAGRNRANSTDNAAAKLHEHGNLSSSQGH